MAKNIAKTWAEKCAQSNGSMVIVPAEMSTESDEFHKKSEVYLALAKEFDKASAEFDLFAKNFWHKMRLELESIGVADIWGKNIGWNTEAKKDGIKVINIVAGSGGPMQMRG
jgi:hypothetical protein